ncbi:hypothetical protein D6C83_02656, partial [Aureobasidium pullulans]
MNRFSTCDYTLNSLLPTTLQPHLHLLRTTFVLGLDKELKQLPDELKTKIEQRIEQPLLSKTSHAAAEVANQESLKSDLDDTVMQAIFHGSLPFDAFEPNKHPHILRLCRMITPDFVPPSRSRVAQAMVKLSTQPV